MRISDVRSKIAQNFETKYVSISEDSLCVFNTLTTACEEGDLKSSI